MSQLSVVLEDVRNKVDRLEEHRRRHGYQILKWCMQIWIPVLQVRALLSLLMPDAVSVQFRVRIGIRVISTAISIGRDQARG